MAGIGDFLGLIGKLGDRFTQGKKESLRNKIDNLKREIDNYVVANKPTWGTANARKYSELSHKLFEAEQELKNIQ